MPPAYKNLLRQNQFLPLLRKHDFVEGFSKSTVDHLCAAGKGPPPDFVLGSVKLYKPQSVLRWANDRIRPAGPADHVPARRCA